MLLLLVRAGETMALVVVAVVDRACFQSTKSPPRRWMRASSPLRGITDSSVLR